MEKAVKSSIIRTYYSSEQTQEVQEILKSLEGEPGYVEYCKFAMFEACRVGNSGILEYLVRESRSVDSLFNSDEKGETPLHIASKWLNVEVCKLIMQITPCKLNIPSIIGQTPLHLAIQAEDDKFDSKVEIIKLLLAIPDCDPNIRDAKGDTPLIAACKLVSCQSQAYLTIIDALLSSCCDPWIQNNDGNTALHIAAAGSCQGAVKALVYTKNCELNLFNKDGETPLHIACKSLQIAAVNILLETGKCIVNMQTITGQTPLHLAVGADGKLESKLEIIQLLLAIPNCDSNIQNSVGDTPLIAACHHVNVNSLTINTLICGEKCDPNIQNYEGNTALHLAVVQNSRKTMQVLVCCRRYKPDLLNLLIETPLHIACSELNINAVTVLLKEGRCDVNAQTNTGQTPLHLAIGADGNLESKLEIIQLLLAIPDCDPNMQNSGGDTPLILACHHINVNSVIIHTLISREKCDPNIQNYGGNTALHFAVVQNSRKTMRVLVCCKRSKSDLRNKLGESPLHKACSQLNVNAVTVLLKEGRCDVNAQTNTGQTPLHLAITAKWTSEPMLKKGVISLLLEAPNCDPHIADAKGVTPLQTAHKLCADSQIFILLLEKGCEEGYSKRESMIEQAMTLMSNSLLCHIARKSKSVILSLLPANSPYINNGMAPSSRDPQLISLVKGGHAKRVEMMLERQCCDPNVRNANGNTPLIIACIMSSMQIIHSLLHHKKCEVSTQNHNRFTALHFAAVTCQDAVKPIILHEKYKPNLPNRFGETPLHIACLHLSIETVTVLLKDGRCDVNAQTKAGRTPLHLALADKRTSEPMLKERVIYLLLEIPDCDPHIADAHGITPLQIAHKLCADSQIFILLLEKGCEEGYSKRESMIEQAMTLMSNSILHHIARKSKSIILPFLLSYSNVATSRGDPLLISVIRGGNAETVEMLLECRCCDPNVRDAHGDTPLIIACIMSSMQIIISLLRLEKCDVSAQNHDGNTALHYAAATCQDAVKCIIFHEKCKPNLPNMLGETPLHIACSKMNIQAVKVLLKSSRCDVNAQTNTGQTPLHLALTAIPNSKQDVKENIICSLLQVPHCDLRIVDTQGVTALQTAYETNIEVFILILAKTCEEDYSMANEVIQLSIALTDNNLLHILVQMSAATVMRNIIKMQGSPTIVNKVEKSSGDTPLMAAIKAEYVEAVEVLLECQYCDPNVRTASNEDTPLIVACRRVVSHYTGERLQILYLLLSNIRCDLNGQNEKGNTALHIAAAGSCQEVVAALVGHERCKPNLANNQGRNPLHVACGELNVPNVTEILQNRKSNINQQTATDQTPLHLAVRARKVKPGSKLELIHILLSHPDCHSKISTQNTTAENQQCDPNVQDSSGDTPLHIAVEDNTCDTLKALLGSEKTDPNVQNYSGETPLHIASRLRKHKYVFAMTESKCCDINVQDNNGYTALHTAIYNMQQDDLSIIEHLISDSMCDLGAGDLQGNTALHLACAKAAYKEDENILTLIRLLLSTGKVDPQCVNNAGETPAQLAISNKKVYQELSLFNEAQLKHPIQTFVKVFVVGNAETGKSTLIEAICTEASKGRKYVPSQFKTVKGVKPHTAGIVPIPVHSQHFGNAIIYDFAGQHEYYSSHAAVLENLVLSSPPVFVVLVDLSKPFEQMSEIIAYWWSFIGSYTARSHLNTCPQVIVVGSHKDVVKARGNKVAKIATNLLGTLDGLPTNFTYAGFTALNCTLVASDGLSVLLSLLKKTCHTVRKELHIDLRCHVLSAFLQDKFPTCMACTLTDIIDSIKAEESTLLPQSTPNLVNLLAALSDKDRILLLKNSECLESSWIILQRQELYNKINGSVFAPEYFDEHLTDFAKSTGVVPVSKIKKHFPQHHPDIITGFLSHLEFCFKIGDAQTLELIADEEEYSPDEEFYFFPALVQVKNPHKEKVWKNEVYSPVNKQKVKCGWFYECSHPYQYLMTRFLHVLLFRLAFSFALVMEHRPSHNFPAIRRRCSVWKRGIAWLNNDGIETVLEVGLQNQWVVLLMQCSAGMEVECAKLRSAVVKIILDTKEEFCPSIGMYESLLHPCNVDYPFQKTDQLSLYRLKEVSRVLVQRRPCAVDEGGSNSIPLVELLPFEPYTGLGEVFLAQLFTSKYAQHRIPACSIKGICQTMLTVTDAPVERLKLLARALLPQVATQFFVKPGEDPVALCVNLIQKAEVKTYQNLEEKLSSFSIFCGRYLLELAGLVPPEISDVTEFENDLYLEQIDYSLLCIESLLEVRTEVVPAVGHSASLGLALGLSQTPTLQVIQHNWPDDVAFQLTEIMAAWLQGKENSSWRSLAKALMDPAVDCPAIARTIMKHHPHQRHCSVPNADFLTYHEVNGTAPDESFASDVLSAVVQGSHFSWFHLGLVLGLHYDTLKAIPTERTGQKECVAAVILKWLNQVDSVGRRGQPSWRVLARALAHPLVGQHRLADEVAREHPAQEGTSTSVTVSQPEIADTSAESSLSLHPLPPSPPPAHSPPSSLSSSSH